MKIKLSTIAISIVLLVCCIIDLDLKNWRKTEKVIEYDIHGYYAYLPAQFIYNDIKLEKSTYQYGKNLYWFWYNKTEDGKPLLKSTMGLSILYAPFFFVAHGYALLSDYPKTGFSEPYKLFLLLSTLFYFVVGLDFLRKILRHYSFSDAHIAITIVLLGLGTNILCYASQSAPMPHVYLFCLIAIFIFYTIKWYEAQSTKNAIVLGLLFGLITLIRPSNAIIAIFFLLYNITNYTEFKQRIFSIIQKPALYFLILFLTLLVWVPQCIYWKIVTGHFISYSYTDEGFYFLHPHFIGGLFSFRKGWLLYTPIMGFAIIGIYYLKNQLKKLQVSISIFLLLNMYIIFSWWCWWYGGSYGQRSFIDSYALMALPLASFVKIISEKKVFVKATFVSIGVFFIWLNVFQTYQMEFASLHWDAMTKELYFKQFGTLEKIEGFDNYLDHPDYELAKNGGKQIVAAVKSVENNKLFKKIQLKAANGKFVSVNNNYNLVATSEIATDSSTFQLIYSAENKVNLKFVKGMFVSADHTRKNALRADRQTADAWETFTLIKINDTHFALRSDTGKYFTVNTQSFILFATSDLMEANEIFEFVGK
jgi:hypothetical protein